MILRSRVANCSDSLRGHAAFRLGHFALLARGYMSCLDSILSDRKPANAEESTMSEPTTEVRLGLRHDPTNQWMMDGTEPKIFYDEHAAARIANLQELLTIGELR